MWIRKCAAIGLSVNYVHGQLPTLNNIYFCMQKINEQNEKDTKMGRECKYARRKRKRLKNGKQASNPEKWIKQSLSEPESVVDLEERVNKRMDSLMSNRDELNE